MTVIMQGVHVKFLDAAEGDVLQHSGPGARRGGMPDAQPISKL